MPLYREVADDIEQLIHQGTLAPGTRIPSLRKTSRRLAVSLTTVMEAYRLLEDRGLVEVRPQSGHYVKLAAANAPPEPARTPTCDAPSELDAADLIEQLVREASQPGLVMPFGAAVPAPEFLPISRLNGLLSRAVRREPIVSQSYDSIPGRPELRRQIARLAVAGGSSLTADDLVVTTGAQEAISLALRVVVRPGDTVAIESPTYHGFLQVLENLHVKALELATDPREGICPDAVAEALSDGQLAAVVVVSSFGNPMGHRMPDQYRRLLVQRLRAARVPLIEDDTYGELGFEGPRPRTLHSFDQELATEDGAGSNVLLLSSFSKILAPGLRVGWIAPGRFRKEVVMQKYASSLATATPTQLAIADYLAAGGLSRHVRKLRRSFKDLVRRMITEIGEHFPSGTRVTRPAGGYLLWVEMPEDVDAFALHRAALAEDISITPGPIFSASGRYGNCIRLNCAVPWSDTVARAIRLVGELARSQTD
ncbi:MAG: PLP-dependent aminotransferase family protein [Thermoanaerobaculia bacterium]|nr:PLP-dependent aminotransferase family protein [Thermoanaerobaculia bacterium]